MFKRHVYTCPDVVYLINRQKRINQASIGLSLIFWGGMVMYGNHLAKKDERKLEELRQL